MDNAGRMTVKGAIIPEHGMEGQFRADSLVDESRMATAIVVIWMIPLVAFARNDWALRPGGSAVGSLMALRALVVVSGLLVLGFFRRSRNPTARDAALSAWIVLYVAVGLAVQSIRPPDFLAPLLTDVVGIVTCWALLPLPFTLQGFAAAVVTTAAVLSLVLFKRPLHEAEAGLVFGALALAHLCGASISWLSHRARRLRFIAVQETEVATRALVTAQRQLAEARIDEMQSQLVHVQRAGGMGSLATALAHELGQPLTAIRNNAFAGLAYLGRGVPDLAGARAALEDVGGEAQRASEIIRRMRDYLRRGQLREEAVTAEALARDALALVAGAARRRGVSVGSSIAVDAPEVTGDRVQLLQVAIIALVNALDAVGSHTGGRTVTLWARRGVGCLEMGVDDDGPGIEAALRTKVFEPFFTTKGDGLGMGLPIARTIIEAHGGSISVDAAPGGGARIAWTIPTTAPSRPHAAATACPSATSGRAGAG